jgi:hypothetical protein
MNILYVDEFYKFLMRSWVSFHQENNSHVIHINGKKLLRILRHTMMKSFSIFLVNFNVCIQRQLLGITTPLVLPLVFLQDDISDPFG